MSSVPRPEPVDREQQTDPHNPLEDVMDTDPQPSTPTAEPSSGPTGTATIGTEPISTERIGTESTRRAPRVGTVVWGLVIAAVGVGILALAAGFVFDVELALITLVAAAGVALLVGSLITGVRRSGR